VFCFISGHLCIKCFNMLVLFNLLLPMGTCYLACVFFILILYGKFCDHLCDLVVRVPGYRSRGPGSIPSATRFSEKLWVWNGVHSAS
jgi:hypothetical protein